MKLSNLVKNRLRRLLRYGETVDDNFQPGKYPGIALATRSKGHDAKEVPGFAVVISRRFFCSIDNILHVKRAPRITLNISFKSI